MEPQLLRYIWRYSSRQQIGLILLTAASFPILYLSLELPKIIVNEAIENHASPKTVLGYDFGPIDYVLFLCTVYLMLLLGNGWFKMRINTFKGIVGERMLRRLRFTLIDHALRFPLPHYARVSAGEVISTVTAETEPLAGFIGDSYALPAMQGGTMLTILLFMFIQDPLLGLASVSMIPLQVYIIPKLQKRINKLKKQRVQKVRKLSERLNENMTAAQEIRLQGTHRYQMADFSTHLGDIFWVRLQIYEAKFFMKFINNLLNQLTPILFLSIGGILVIEGNITIGVILAALTAYKDMTAPWKELLNYYQTWQDSLIKYAQIRESFEPDGLVTYNHIANTPDLPQSLNGGLTLTNLTTSSESGDLLLNNICLDVKPGELVIIDSQDSTTMKRLAHTIRGLASYDSGQVCYDGMPLSQVPHVTLGRRVAVAGPEPIMFAGSVMQNFHYGLRHAPPPDDKNTLTPERLKEIDEACKSGNSTERMDDIWTDFSVLGITGFEELRPWFNESMTAVGADKVLFHNGIMQTYKKAHRPDRFWESFVQTRHALAPLLKERQLDHLVNRFDVTRYNTGLSIRENIFFGIFHPDGCSAQDLSQSEEFLSRLLAHDLWLDVVRCGLSLARQIHTIIGGMNIDDPMVEQFSGLDKETVSAVITLQDQLAPTSDTEGANQPTQTDDSLLIQLFLAIIPDKHGTDLIDAALGEKLLSLRQDVLSNPLTLTENCITVFDPDTYHEDLTILENLCFGRLKEMTTNQMTTLLTLAEDTLRQNQAREYVMVLFGLGEVGIGGARLPVIAKQRIQLARAIMKKPDILILHEPLSVFSPPERVEIIQNIRRSLPELTTIWMDQAIPEDVTCDQRFKLHDGKLSSLDAVEEVDMLSQTSGEQAINDLLTQLEQSRLYADLSPANRRLIAAHGEFLTLERDELLFQYGDEPRNVYFVLSGKLDFMRRNPDGSAHKLTFFIPGDTIGIPEIVSGVPRYADVRVAEDQQTACKLWRIQADLFLKLLEDNNAMALKVIGMLGRRMFESSQSPPS